MSKFICIAEYEALRSSHLIEACDDPLDLAALPALEDEVGHVEHDALQEEHERHPLVVRLVGHLVSVGVVGPDAGLHRCQRLSDN